MRLFSLEKRVLRMDLHIQIPEGRVQKESDRLFPVVQDRTRDKEHKLVHRRFPLNIRKHFFTVQVMEHWHVLPRKAMESPSEIVKICLNI